MNPSIVAEINNLQVEKAEFKSTLKNLEINKDAYLESGEMEENEIEDIKKEIASIDAQIADLSSHLYDEDVEEEESEEEEEEVEDSEE